MGDVNVVNPKHYTTSRKTYFVALTLEMDFCFCFVFFTFQAILNQSGAPFIDFSLLIYNEPGSP